jgi:hypothetical protein
MRLWEGFASPGCFPGTPGIELTSRGTSLMAAADDTSCAASSAENFIIGVLWQRSMGKDCGEYVQDRGLGRACDELLRKWQTLAETVPWNRV